MSATVLGHTLSVSDTVSTISLKKPMDRSRAISAIFFAAVALVSAVLAVFAALPAAVFAADA